MLYLEVSPRQSGKSNRLLEAVHLSTLNNPGISPVVYATTNDYARQLKQRYQEKYGKTQLVKFLQCDKDNICGIEGPYFFDEFDLYKENTWFNYVGPTELIRAYFSTTAKKMRKLVDLANPKTHDILGILLQASHFIYEFFPMIQPNADHYKIQFENLPLETFNLQVQGLFIQQ